MKMNLVDRAIAYFDPSAGRERAVARMQIEASGAYAGASRSRPSLKSWWTSRKSADEDLNPELNTLRSRSRDLERNNPLAHGALKTKTTYVIGTGLRPEPNIDADYLGLTSEQAEKLQAQILREFELVATSPEGDAARRKTFYQKQAEIYHSSRTNGDAFLLLPHFERGDWPYHTRFQSVESDRVCNPNNKPDTDSMSGGFELDQHGATDALHILQCSPTRRFGKGSNAWQRVPVYRDNGARNVLILSNHNLRAGQTRGVPDLAPVIEVIKQAGRYVDAELMASVISSKFTVFIKSEGGGSRDPYAPGGAGDEDYDDAGSDDPEERDLRLGDGLVTELDEGESIETANPGRPNAQFDPFVTALWRQIGGALGIPFEVLLKHFTASYSASRAALLQFSSYILVDRADVVVSICQPYYEAIIAEAVARGRLHMPGFFKDPMIRRAYCRALWHGPVMGEIDELKAANAAEKRLKIGITTNEREARRNVGESWSQMNEQRRIEERRKWQPSAQGDGAEPDPEEDPDDNDNRESPAQRRASHYGG
ncbi:phage portal protein [Kushneria pakistanensis]|uniref:Phage portal protein n=1 Tax=Kushneria pakistanensis TaxID=1508770 RepID=A0ABQ3FQX3_9GAMM|nr:phage portal protein [Kushneria pakistanensis]GHC34630.1 phage portal protein [Kushneria pakistanensis]